MPASVLDLPSHLQLYALWIVRSRSSPRATSVDSTAFLFCLTVGLGVHLDKDFWIGAQTQKVLTLIAMLWFLPIVSPLF